jgi:preprotein translocase subunit SecD
VPILILVIGAMALFIDFMPGPNGPGSGAKFFSLTDPNAGLVTPQTKLGLDLSGGFEIKYGVDTGGKGDPKSAELGVIRSIMETRVNSTGVSEPIVETVGASEILIQVPGATNKKQIEDLVGQAGQLTFVLLPPADYGTGATTTSTTGTTGSKTVPAKDQPIDPALPPQFKGADLDLSQIVPQADPKSPAGYWEIAFGFAGSKASEFETWTGAHTGNYMAIVLDGIVQSAPVIQGTLTGGRGVITGNFSPADAKYLATILQYGALPYPVKEESSQEIPATLGQAFLNQTLFAGAVGIGLVLLFMLVYYRLPGLIACMALVYYGLTVLGVMRIIPVTLTLAGIASFVLSVGMAVDANILIFERTKEELRAGKTLATAVEAGFNRAWNSIFDSNVSSLITASILYFGGSSTIKGFALVLIIGVATSMFTAVTVSRTLLRFVVKQHIAQKAWLFGVSDEEFQARAMGGRLARRENRGRV